MTLNTRELLALAGPVSYFALVIFLFALIITSLDLKKINSSAFSVIYALLALVSFLHTFTYILLDLKWSYHNYFDTLPYTVVGTPIERMSVWLMNTSIFKEIWVYGSDGIFNWWWLENLCIMTAGTWTVFLVSEGKVKNVPYLWAYMIIAQVVAVSTASSLFFLALSQRPTPTKVMPSKKDDDDINSVLPAFEPEPEVTAQTIVPVLLGLFTISTCPAPKSPDFLSNILILHALLFIPVLPTPFQTDYPRWLKMPTVNVYFAATALSLALRIQSTLFAASSLPEIGILEFAKAAFACLQSHPGMATFGWDTIYTTVLFLIWATFGDGTSKPKTKALIPVVTATAALGISFSGPMALGNVIDELFVQTEVTDAPVV